MIISSRGTLDVPSLGRLPTQHGITVGFGGVERKAVMGDNGLLGNTEESTEAPMIKCKLSDTKSLDKSKLQNVVDETITLQLNNNQAYTLTHAFISNPLELDTSSGDVEVEFRGAELIDIS